MARISWSSRNTVATKNSLGKKKPSDVFSIRGQKYIFTEIDCPVKLNQEIKLVYTITISDPDIIYFTNRYFSDCKQFGPEITSTLNSDEFAVLWKNLDQTNGILSWVSSDQQSHHLGLIVGDVKIHQNQLILTALWTTDRGDQLPQQLDSQTALLLF